MNVLCKPYCYIHGHFIMLLADHRTSIDVFLRCLKHSYQEVVVNNSQQAGVNPHPFGAGTGIKDQHKRDLQEAWAQPFLPGAQQE